MLPTPREVLHILRHVMIAVLEFPGYCASDAPVLTFVTNSLSAHHNILHMCVKDNCLQHCVFNNVESHVWALLFQ